VLLHLTPLTVGLSQEDRRFRVTVGDNIDVHGYYYTYQTRNIKYIGKTYMATKWMAYVRSTAYTNRLTA